MVRAKVFHSKIGYDKLQCEGMRTGQGPGDVISSGRTRDQEVATDDL